MLVASALTMVACGTAGKQQPATVAETATTPATSATSAGAPAKPVTYVTLPDVYGQNADTVKTKLEDLGLTKVELASSNTKFSTVQDPKDWKVAGMEPGAGSVVRSDAPVILKVVKVK